MTALTYLKKRGGHSFSSAERRGLVDLEVGRPPNYAQVAILGRTLEQDSRLVSQENRVIGSKWTLHRQVVDRLLRIWPATMDVFGHSPQLQAASLLRSSKDSMSTGTDDMSLSRSGLQLYAFPTFSLIQSVLNNLRQSTGVQRTLIAPWWTRQTWFADLLDLALEIFIHRPSRTDLLNCPISSGSIRTSKVFVLMPGD